MRLVGLISGGKDSMYNMLQCISAGHEIVAVANIQPETNGDLDSYMYQTVGHEVITLIAKALCVPIFKQKTKGKAVILNKDYVRTAHDEVEDLATLLVKVKKDIKVDGVAVGAIASDYQRTRVENVCARLGLKCYAYLWRRNQIELLQEMIDAEVNAIIVKVACIGLNESHLGMSLKDIQPYLLELEKKFGVNVCGEGGEYETITLDCPLYQRSIKITESEKVTLRNDEFAPVCILKVKKASLDVKSWETGGTLKERTDVICTKIKGPYSFVRDCTDDFVESGCNLAIPNLPCLFKTDDDDDDDEDDVDDGDDGAGKSAILRGSLKGTVLSAPSAIVNLKIHNSSGWCFIGNVTAPTINAALIYTQKYLKRMNYDLHEVVFVNLYVKNMDDFAIMNADYSLYVPELLPPARACVETILPDNVGVILSVVAHKHVSRSKVKKATRSTEDITLPNFEREGLHVQSISHWAPANIGPYSQCIVASEIYYVSGQIPLIPGLMEVLTKPIFYQCKLTLRHVLRVLQVMNPTLNFSSIFHAICYVTAVEFAADMSFLWSFITKVDTTPIVVVVVKKLPNNARLEWEVIASGSKNPSVLEETLSVDNFELLIKSCTYTEDDFCSSLVCRIRYVESKPGKTLKVFTPTAVSNALTLCAEILRRHSKTEAPLCMLKIFYVAKSSTIAQVLHEITPPLIEMKVIATSIPVVACDHSDTLLIVSGVCM